MILELLFVSLNDIARTSRMSNAIYNLFDSLPPVTEPVHLPKGGITYVSVCAIWPLLRVLTSESVGI